MRQIDWMIVPLVTFLYLLCFLDRANIGYDSPNLSEYQD
jgi:hypothetical protein